MTTSTTSEKSVEVPSGLDDLEGKISDKRAAIDRLEAVSNEIDALYGSAADMDGSSRETVAQEMQKLQHEVVSVASIDELEAAKDRIADIIAAPYRQAVIRARTTVCETVGIGGRLYGETIEELNETLQRCESDELRSMETSLNQIQDQLTTLPDAAQTAVGELLLDQTYPYLTEPETRLKPVIDTVEAQSDALEAVDNALAGLTWGPATPLAHNSEYYDDSVSAVDADTIVQYVNTVDDRLADTDGLNLRPVCQAHLSQGLPVEKPAGLVELFEGLSHRITLCASHETAYVRASTLVDRIEDPSAHEAGDVAGYIDEVDGFVESPSGDEPAHRLAGKLSQLADAYQQWAETYASWLTRDAVAIAAVDSLTELPDYDSPAEAIDLTGQEVTTEMVADRPTAAVAVREAYEAWVETLRGEASADGEANIDTLLALVRGEAVSASDVDPEEFATLSELLGGELMLNLTNGPKEA